jgi:hypothetical protein
MDRTARVQDFVRAYCANWFSLMSGGPSVPAAVLAVFVTNASAKILLGLTAAVLFIISSFFVWRAERIRVIALDKTVQLEAARTRWAELRAEGVALRNEGKDGLFDDSLWEKWRLNTVIWNTEVLNAIRSVNDADATWFSILDVVPSPRLPMDGIFRSESDELHYAMHDFRLVKLEGLILKHGA